MNPQPSPIETLRQLREMLDAGTITAAEFEALKQQLVFSTQVPPAPAAAPPVPEVAVPATQDSPVPEAVQLPAEPVEKELYQTVAAPVESPAWSASAAQELEQVHTPPARNPLNLVLALGGLLVLLSVMAYLAFNQRDSEHISSNTMTAADSVSVVEEGPQAEPVEQSVVVPDTVRIAPTNPAPPVVKPGVAPAVSDSTAAVPAVVDSTTQP